MYNKPIIVFEGIEGSGKTTHLKNITSYLKQRKVKYISLREPGGSKNSEKIRKLILDKKSNFDQFTDLLLYLASRNENVQKTIKKYYKKKIILIDRFSNSTFAYQHYGMGIDYKIINIINKYILKKIKPDFIFLSTVKLKEMKKRLKFRKKNNRYDEFKISFYRKVQNGFIKMLKNNKNVEIIDTSDTLENNKNQILERIKKLI